MRTHGFRRRRYLGILAFLAVAGMIALRRARPFPVRVAGRSMSPALVPGDLLVVLPLRRPPRRGDVVVARRDGLEIVKRVTGVPGDRVVVAGQAVALPQGEYSLTGDNPEESTDSREVGPFSGSAIVGVVCARYWPLRRVSRLRPGEPRSDRARGG